MITWVNCSAKQKCISIFALKRAFESNYTFQAINARNHFWPKPSLITSAKLTKTFGIFVLKIAYFLFKLILLFANINYEVNGLCALIPIAQRISFLHYLLAPFDETSWIFLMLLIVVWGAIWQVFGKQSEQSDSALYWSFCQFFGQFLNHAFLLQFRFSPPGFCEITKTKHIYE